MSATAGPKKLKVGQTGYRAQKKERMPPPISGGDSACTNGSVGGWEGGRGVGNHVIDGIVINGGRQPLLVEQWWRVSLISIW